MLVEIKVTQGKDVTASIKFDEKDKELVTILRFDTVLHPSDIARIMNLRKNNQAIYLVVGSTQAEMDLSLNNVTVTKEPAPAVEKTVPAAAPAQSVLGEKKDGDKTQEIPRCPGCGFILDPTLEKGDNKCPSCGEPLPVPAQVSTQKPQGRRKKNADAPPAVA